MAAGPTPLTFINVLTGTSVAQQGAAGVGSAGTLVAPYALSYSVNYIGTDEARVHPTQTLAPTSVDLIADQVSPGVFAVDWDVPSMEPLGLHEVLWTLTATASATPQTFRREFDVLNGIAGLAQNGYALVSDFRHEGITVERASDVRLQLLIEQWSRQIDLWTRRFFEPRTLSLLLDGYDSTSLTLRLPIIGIADVSAVDDTGFPNPIDMTALRFYNRHLTEGMTQPDDRDAPRIEFVLLQPILIGMSNTYYPQQMFRAGRFSQGTQNVRITGTFGYTELDGSPSGVTPSLIRRATQLLVLRNLPKLARVNERFDARESHRKTTESTRGQSYTLAPRWGGRPGGQSEDPEIDSILDQFSAPIQLASTSGGGVP